jgi:hypothetical protein
MNLYCDFQFLNPSRFSFLEKLSRIFALLFGQLTPGSFEDCMRISRRNNNSALKTMYEKHSICYNFIIGIFFSSRIQVEVLLVK